MGYMTKGARRTSGRGGGAPHRLTPQWKAEAEAEFKRRGRGSMQEAAAAIGVSPSNISKMLDPRMKMSEHAEALSTYLGISMPTVDVTSSRQERWISVAARAQASTDPEEEDELLAAVEERIAQHEERRRLAEAGKATMERLRPKK